MSKTTKFLTMAGLYALGYYILTRKSPVTMKGLSHGGCNTFSSEKMDCLYPGKIEESPFMHSFLTGLEACPVGTRLQCVPINQQYPTPSPAPTVMDALTARKIRWIQYGLQRGLLSNYSGQYNLTAYGSNIPAYYFTSSQYGTNDGNILNFEEAALYAYNIGTGVTQGPQPIYYGGSV